MADKEIPDIQTAQGGPTAAAAGDVVHAFRTPNTRAVTLGDAAGKSVGTGAGTVAAGDTVAGYGASIAVLMASTALRAIDTAQIGGYQAKSQSGFTGYRRGKNKLWDGFADTSGVNAGRSANYNVDTSAKCIKPTVSGTTVSSGTASGTVNYGLTTIIDMGAALTAADVISEVGADLSAAQTVTVKIAKRNSAGNFDIVVSESFAHPGGGFANKVLSSNYTVPGSGSYYVGISLNATEKGRASVVSRAFKDGSDVTGTGQTGFTEGTSVNIPPMRYVKNPTVANLKYSSTLQTSDAAVTSVTAFFEIDTIDAITLGTDLTGIATCNGWTNNGAVTLTSVGKGQAGRAIVKAVATGLTSGISFGLELQYANNRNGPIYWTEVSAE